MSLWTILGIIAVVLVIAAVVNRKAVANIFGAGRDQLGKLGRAAANADPLAALQQGIDDATEQVKKSKQGLQRAVALVKSVERQVISGRQEKARLEARVKNALAEKNEPKAQEYAAMLGDCEGNLAENEKQLNSHQEAYNGYVADVRRQQEKVSTLQREAQNLGIRLEMSESNKQFNEFQQTFSLNNGALDGLAAKREAVLKQIDANNAVGQVEKDVGRGTVSAYEEEDADLDRQIKAKEILARFQQPAQTASN